MQKQTSKERANFWRIFNVMVSSGLALLNTLDILAKQSTDEKFQNTILNIKQSISEGTTMSGAMAKYPETFSKFEIDMVNVGEQFGTLDIIAKKLAVILAETSFPLLLKDEETKESAEKLTTEEPVIKLVNAILKSAIKQKASDIHIEPYENRIRVRFRIGSKLYEQKPTPPFSMKDAIVSRIKILSALDIAERRVPQDGAIRIKMVNQDGNEVQIDLRISILPVMDGERIVMRILDKSNLIIDDLKQYITNPKAYNDLVEAVHQPYGMILVTGPTGSGKTTTLYSAMQLINTPEINILSVTGAIAIKAALIGHLVFSALHTNDAPSTISRMINMGLEPFMISSSVICIMAQRLLRRNCSECNQPIELHQETLNELGLLNPEIVRPILHTLQAMGKISSDIDIDNLPDHEKVKTILDLANFKKGKGCSACHNIGYKGRIAIYQVMPISSKIKEMILDGASTLEIEAQSIKENVLTLRHDALCSLLLGKTTAEEVLHETIPLCTKTA